MIRKGGLTVERVDLPWSQRAKRRPVESLLFALVLCLALVEGVRHAHAVQVETIKSQRAP